MAEAFSGTVATLGTRMQRRAQGEQSSALYPSFKASEEPLRRHSSWSVNCGQRCLSQA